MRRQTVGGDYRANPGHLKQNTCPYRKFDPTHKSRFFSANVRLECLICSITGGKAV
jgi:hypothetical protein